MANQVQNSVYYVGQGTQIINEERLFLLIEETVYNFRLSTVSWP